MSHRTGNPKLDQLPSELTFAFACGVHAYTACSYSTVATRKGLLVEFPTTPRSHLRI